MYKPSTSKYTITFEFFETHNGTYGHSRNLDIDTYFNTLEEAIIFAKGFQLGRLHVHPAHDKPCSYMNNFYIKDQTTGEAAFPEKWEESLEGKDFLLRKMLIQTICTYKHNDEELAEEIKAFCEGYIMSQIIKRKTEKK